MGTRVANPRGDFRSAQTTARAPAAPEWAPERHAEGEDPLCGALRGEAGAGGAASRAGVGGGGGYWVAPGVVPSTWSPPGAGSPFPPRPPWCVLLASPGIRRSQTLTLLDLGPKAHGSEWRL